MKTTFPLSALLLTCFLSATLMLPAQHQDMFVVKWSPIALFNLKRSHILFNAEYRPQRWLGIELSAGGTFNALRSYSQNHRYNTLRSELRLYFDPQNGSYFALDFFRTQEAFDVGAGIYRTMYRQTLKYSQAVIHRRIEGCNVKFGYAFAFGKYFRLDTYAGVGVGNRFQTVSPIGVKPNDDFWRGLVPDFREGKKQVPTLTVGVSTGIALGGRKAAANKN